MANSSIQTIPSDKPRKPHKDFPLFPHATGRWAKKVRGKFRYFGKVADDPQGQAALDLWLAQKDELLAGRTPKPKADGVAIKDLLNQFRVAKKQLVDEGEIRDRTFAQYHPTLERIRNTFGRMRLLADLTPADFQELRKAIANGRALTSIRLEIAKTRAVFNWGFRNQLLDRPVVYGDSLNSPSAKAIKCKRDEQGNKDFDASEIQAMLANSCPSMRAMILLGVNAGYGNTDLARLPKSKVDLIGGWVTFPRPKTGAVRRAKLWPETVDALKAVLAKPRKPIDAADADLVFLTEHGNRYVRFGEKSWTDSIQNLFTVVMRRAGVRREGRGFYGLRRTFETQGGASLDQVAVDFVMGHLGTDMATVYRQRIGDDRLERVANHVRTWLFSRAPATST